jgi:spore germination protein KA
MEKSIAELLSKNFTTCYQDNKQLIQDILVDNTDLNIREFYFHEQRDIKIVCFFIDGLVNTTQIDAVIDSFIYQAPKLLRELDITTLYNKLPDRITKHILHSHALKLQTKVEDAIEAILSGDTLFVIDKCKDSEGSPAKR